MPFTREDLSKLEDKLINNSFGWQHDLIRAFPKIAEELIRAWESEEQMKQKVIEATESLTNGAKIMREYQGTLIAGEAIDAMSRAFDTVSHKRSHSVDVNGNCNMGCC